MPRGRRSQSPRGDESWMNLGVPSLAVGQNLVPLVNIKIAGKWMLIPLKMVLIGIDPYPHGLDTSISVKTMVRCSI